MGSLPVQATEVSTAATRSYGVCSQLYLSPLPSTLSQPLPRLVTLGLSTGVAGTQRLHAGCNAPRIAATCTAWRTYTPKIPINLSRNFFLLLTGCDFSPFFSDFFFLSECVCQGVIYFFTSFFLYFPYSFLTFLFICSFLFLYVLFSFFLCFFLFFSTISFLSWLPLFSTSSLYLSFYYISINPPLKLNKLLQSSHIIKPLDTRSHTQTETFLTKEQ